MWPDTDSEWKYVDRAPDPAIEATGRRESSASWWSWIAESPLRFRFDPDAQELFIEWLTDLEAKVRGDELHPALVSHLSKYRSLMPALALLFELADRAAAGVEITNGPDLLVSLEHAKQAAAFCDYLESHACRIYSCVTTPQMRAAQELADKIKTPEGGCERLLYAPGCLPEGLERPRHARGCPTRRPSAGGRRLDS